MYFQDLADNKAIGDFGAELIKAQSNVIGEVWWQIMFQLIAISDFWNKEFKYLDYNQWRKT